MDYQTITSASTNSRSDDDVLTLADQPAGVVEFESDKQAMREDNYLYHSFLILGKA